MIGFGYDIHQLAEGESLILGGIHITSDKGTIAHSDGDVLIHSIIDALLGAACMGDIGDLFPDTDKKYKNIDSTELLKIVDQKIKNKGLRIGNIDTTIVLEKPKLLHYKTLMKENIADILNISSDKVNIKATTNEKQDSIGKQESIAVYSVCMLVINYNF